MFRRRTLLLLPLRRALTTSSAASSAIMSSSPGITTSTSASTSASPFTRAVVASMRTLYPESLADKSFDNTGLLLEAPFDHDHAGRPRNKNSVLLTIDLTTAVADEAIARQDSVVVAYHPIIFRGLKALTLGDTQQTSLLRLAAAGISVYSPHTAVDAVPGGLGDWLAEVVVGSRSHIRAVEPPTITATTKAPTVPKPEEHKVSIIQPCAASPIPTGFEGAGMGRLVTFARPQPLTTLLEHISSGVVGGLPSDATPAPAPASAPVPALRNLSLAIPHGKSIHDMQIRTVAICAGSGGSLFRKVEADLYFTGELSHHEALALIERGSSVVTLFHSNTERGYLRQVLRGKLEGVLRREWARVRREEVERMGEGEGGKEEGKEGGKEGGESKWNAVLEDESVKVDVSENDRDPYQIVQVGGGD